jgi:hypothetical protein
MPALRFGDLVVLPNLGEPVSPASDLVFAFEAVAERAPVQPRAAWW